MAKVSQKNLYSRFKKYIADNDLVRVGEKIVIACSGGPDSIALLYLLSDLSKELNLKLYVAHFNHKLRGREADRDEEFVKKQAEKLGLEFFSAKATVKIKNEEQAREQRYKFLEKIFRKVRGDRLAVAHNLDDLAETVLLNIVRGTGIRGLYSLRAVRGIFVRPLLFAEKQEILSYLKEGKISFRHDKSNDKLVYTRNIMRHSILPEIGKLNPLYRQSLARLSTIAAESDLFVSDCARDAISSLAKHQGGKIIFPQKKFTSLSPAVQKEVVRTLTRNAGISRDLSFDQVSEVLDLVNKNIGKKQKTLREKLKIELEAGKIIISTIKTK